MKKLFLFTLLAIVAISFNACSKDETWPDDSPIIEFKDSYFLEALVKGLTRMVMAKFLRRKPLLLED